MERINRPCKWLVLLAVITTGCATTGEPANDGSDDSDEPGEPDGAVDASVRYDGAPGQPDAAGPELVFDAAPRADAAPSYDARPFDPNVIDDLDDGDDNIPMVNGRRGFWYVYNDESASGTQTPPSNNFAPTAMGADGSAFAARTTGSGFTVWGAGMGFDLNAPPQDGAPKGSFDASGFTGIAFKAKGSVAIRVLVQTAGVLPTAMGGTCTPGTAAGTECEDAHGKDVSLTTTWKEYQVPWTGPRRAAGARWSPSTRRS
jgi:hypothetical protein